MQNLKFIALALLLFVATVITAQSDYPTPTSSDKRNNTNTLKLNTISNSLTANIKGHNIGPTVQSGRISEIAVNPKDPSIFYVAYASGGLWKTENNGTSFTPLFDQESVMTIGSIAVDWKTNTIWVGTGEVNSSRSSYAGNGIYKSTDNGHSWEYLGLAESHHIGRIKINPNNSNIVTVAVLGHLYSTNSERGIYQTTDGGLTWNHNLFITEGTGVVDLVVDPQNTDIMYAAAWERDRKAWNFVESGENSGIYKSTDSGATWVLISGGESGFPKDNGTGRIGLAIYNDGTTNKIYAFLDNYNRRPLDPKEDQKEGLEKDNFKTMTVEAFAKLDTNQLADFLKSNRFPEKYSATAVKQKVSNGDLQPRSLAEYLESANSLLFDTDVISAEIYVSEDQGATWTKTHADYLDGIVYSYGYYFGQMRVSPHDSDRIYVMGVPIIKSADGGKTFENIGGDNVHADHHELWLNPNRDGHMINGNDGGINISYDDGKHWIKCNTPSVGQFYTVNVDQAEPYNVYGGLQDNGVWVGSNEYKESTRWHQTGQYPYKMIMGGDGMQIQIDNRDNNTVYTGYQFGNYFRMDRNGGNRSYITPKHDLGERPFRWNWQTPILLSPHNQDILYMGSNFLHRSFNQGMHFEKISEDLTGGGQKGDVPYGTLTTIDESIHKFGVIYTGSDDGYIQLTQDGGTTWSRISDQLPQKMWVSRVQSSKHNKSRVYASLNGYRWDDFTPYVYISDDYGTTWQSIASTLPNEPVNVIKEDPKNEDILYVGTDHGTYVSIDRGAHFMILSDSIPKTPVHDMVIHPTEPDLIIGTHGRSFYKVNISGIRQLSSLQNTELDLLNDVTVKHKSNAGSIRNSYSKANAFEAEVPIFSKDSGAAILSLSIDKNKTIRSWSFDVVKGLSAQTISLDFAEKNKSKIEKWLNKDSKSKDKIKLTKADNGLYYLPVGEYTMTIQKGTTTSSRTFTIKE